jgi:flagellar motor switch protein FliN/FliY
MTEKSAENGQESQEKAQEHTTTAHFEEKGQEKQTETVHQLQELEFLLDVPLELSVEVGRSRVQIKDLLQLREGSVLELDTTSGEPLNIYVNAKLIARGEAVKVNEKIGIRLTEVVSPSERIQKLN